MEQMRYVTSSRFEALLITIRSRYTHIIGMLIFALNNGIAEDFFTRWK